MKFPPQGPRGSAVIGPSLLAVLSPCPSASPAPTWHVAAGLWHTSQDSQSLEITLWGFASTEDCVLSGFLEGNLGHLRRWLVASTRVLGRPERSSPKSPLTWPPEEPCFVPRRTQFSGTTRQVKNEPKPLSVPTMHRFPQGASKVRLISECATCKLREPSTRDA